ncbi:hypothetical protein Jab_2c08160 [Janthinobacterium sp. HH01]|nr:hypothetical protein Jab_2c08160 [Janthinobacterium sp. HH01]
MPTSATPIILPMIRSGAATPSSSITLPAVEMDPNDNIAFIPRRAGSQGKPRGQQQMLAASAPTVPATAPHTRLK